VRERAPAGGNRGQAVIYQDKRNSKGAGLIRPAPRGQAQPHKASPGHQNYTTKAGFETMSKRTVTTFTLGELAQRVIGGNVTAMAKLLNDAGVAPRLDENTPDPSAEVARGR